MSGWVSEKYVYATPIRYDWGYYKQQFKLPPPEKKNHECESIFVFIQTPRCRYSCVGLILTFPMLILLWLSSGLCTDGFRKSLEYLISWGIIVFGLHWHAIKTQLFALREISDGISLCRYLFFPLFALPLVVTVFVSSVL